jgi:hypothetical protein
VPVRQKAGGPNGTLALLLLHLAVDERVWTLASLASVETGATDQPVGTLTTAQEIVALPALQEVGTLGTLHDIVALLGTNGVGTRLGADRVRASRTDQRVCPACSDDRATGWRCRSSKHLQRGTHRSTCRRDNHRT